MSVPSIEPREHDPANIQAEIRSDTDWHPAGHGVAFGSMLVDERRYRLDGSELTFEIHYIADEATDALALGRIDLDGFDPIAGELEWELTIPASETRTLHFRANASRDGVVHSPSIIHFRETAGDCDRISTSTRSSE